jgi:hypothetical protein
VRRVLAVEDQNRVGNIFIVEQVDSEGILVVEINGPINVAALIFIFEAAVDYHSTVISVIIFSIDHVDENAVADPRETVGLVLRGEVWQMQLRNRVDIGYGLDDGTRCQTRILVPLENILWVLKHTERASTQLPWACVRISTFTTRRRAIALRLDHT